MPGMKSNIKNRFNIYITHPFEFNKINNLVEKIYCVIKCILLINVT